MAEKYVIQLEVDSKGAVKGVEEVNNALKQTGKTSEKAIGGAKEEIKGIGEGSKQAKKGVSKLDLGVKGLGLSLKAAGIGLIVSAFLFLKEALMSNQEVVDEFNIVLGTLASLTKQYSELVVDNVKRVYAAAQNFEALGKTIKGVIDIGLFPMQSALKLVEMSLLSGQIAWEKSWLGSGDETKIKELQSSLKEVNEELVDLEQSMIQSVKDVANNVGSAMDEIGAFGKAYMDSSMMGLDALLKLSIEGTYEQSKALVALEKAANTAKATNQGLIEDYDRQAEQQRQIRDNEFNSIADRIAANDKLKEKLDEQKKLMLENATVMKDAAALRFLLSGKDEDEVKLLEAKNELKAVEAQITGFMSEQDSNANALKKESNQLLQTELENTNKVSIAKKRLTAEEIEGEIARLEALKQIDILEAEQETIRLQAIVDTANAGTQAKIDAQIALDDFMIESNINSANRDKELQEAKDIQDKKEIDDAKAVADAKIDISNKEEAAKKAALNGYASALSGISGVIGQETAAGKAIAIASSLVNTYSAIAGQLAVFSGVGAPPIPGYAIAQAIATGVVGLANVKKIASVKVPNSSGGGSSETGSLPSMPSLPEFNIVGQGAGSQIASALGEQQQAPIQAFVVSQDVTTAQSLENNIIQGATLGG